MFIFAWRYKYGQDENASYIIATERLEKVLLPDGETYASDSARTIDEQIFFFVPDAMLSQPEKFAI